jgi:adenylate cyclase
MSLQTILIGKIPTRWWHGHARRLGVWITDRDHRWVIFLLACAMAVWMMGNHWLDREDHIGHADYDWLLSKRVLPPKPDPSIVILDIDESSLAKMNADYGRWPWPRDVLAAVLTDLEAQRAQAIVFDILFADRDALSPNADAAFAQAVEKSTRSFFPVVRLPADADKLSQVKAAELPGLVLVTSDTAKVTPLAMILPGFEAVMATQRLGTINIAADADAVIRRYPLWQDQEGLRIWSLPARVAQHLGWELPEQDKPLLRYMDQPLAFKRISFADYYLDTQRQQRQRDPKEFANTVVLIGATAPTLFDLKNTPIDRLHPGVEVLATALDNLKRKRFIQPPPFWVLGLFTALVLSIMTWVAIRWSFESLSLAFVVAPSLLLLVSYISLNFEGWFFDLSAASAAAFLFFTALKLYGAEQRRRWFGEGWHAPSNPNISHLAGVSWDFSKAGKKTGFDNHVYQCCRLQAPHMLLSEVPYAQFGWMGAGSNPRWFGLWQLTQQFTEAHAWAEKVAFEKALFGAEQGGASLQVLALDGRSLNALKQSLMARLIGSEAL